MAKEQAAFWGDFPKWYQYFAHNAARSAADLNEEQFETLRAWLRDVCHRAPYYESITGEQRIARLDLRFTTLSTLPSPQGFQCRMQLGFSTTRRPRGTRAPSGFQSRSGVPKRPSSWPRARTAA
jgi:hypothetical protein